MNKNKFRLHEYFDTLVSRLDLAVETAISENHHDVNLMNELNNKRDAFINEIRDVQAFNLKALSDLNTEHETSTCILKISKYLSMLI